MSAWMPFTLHLKLDHDRPSRRSEHVYELGRLAVNIYGALVKEARLNLALPGGGQQRNLSWRSDLMYATGVKPQFGDTPPQAQITGFFDATGLPQLRQPERTLIHAGAVLTGPDNNQRWDVMPPNAVDEHVKELVGLVEARLAADLPRERITVFRLDYANLIWGDRGFHFPR